MSSVTGFGGAFIRAKDAHALCAWYERHLGFAQSEGSFAFAPPTQHPHVVISILSDDDDHFATARKAMINLQVDDLDGILNRLIDAGVAVDPKRDSDDFGNSAG